MPQPICIPKPIPIPQPVPVQLQQINVCTPNMIQRQQCFQIPMPIKFQIQMISQVQMIPNCIGGFRFLH